MLAECPGCGQTLDFPDSADVESIRCPACQTAVAQSAHETSYSPSGWYLSAASGEQFGPVDASEIILWLQQGRVGSEVLVWQEGMRAWAEISRVGLFAGHVGPTRLSKPPRKAAEPIATAGFLRVPYDAKASLGRRIGLGLMFGFLAALVALLTDIWMGKPLEVTLAGMLSAGGVCFFACLWKAPTRRQCIILACVLAGVLFVLSILVARFPHQVKPVEFSPISHPSDW